MDFELLLKYYIVRNYHFTAPHIERRCGGPADRRTGTHVLRHPRPSLFFLCVAVARIGLVRTHRLV